MNTTALTLAYLAAQEEPVHRDEIQKRVDRAEGTVGNTLTELYNRGLAHRDNAMYEITERGLEYLEAARAGASTEDLEAIASGKKLPLDGAPTSPSQPSGDAIFIIEDAETGRVLLRVTARLEVFEPVRLRAGVPSYQAA